MSFKYYMVTKYDVFEVVHKNSVPMKPIEVVEKIRKDKSSYKNIYRMLNELKKDGFLVRKDKGFESNYSEKAKVLFDLIAYCSYNDINYNYILDKKLVAFINSALSKNEFKQKTQYAA